MGDRVWQVQKELEELQGRSHVTVEVQTFLTHIHGVNMGHQTPAIGVTTG